MARRDELEGATGPGAADGGATSDTDARSAPSAAPRRRRRIVVATVVTLVLGFWAFALWYSVTRTGPESLDDTVVTELQARCAAAAEALRALEPVDTSASAAQRAGRVRAENEILAAIATTGAPLRTSEPDGQVALDAWARDWDALIAARTEFADALESAEPRRLVVPSDGTRPITLRMDEYARFHALDACSPLTLRAEIVDGPRSYPN